MVWLSFFSVSVELDSDLLEVENRVCVGVDNIELRLANPVVEIRRECFLQLFKSLSVPFV